MATDTPSSYRPDIDGLRAVAVLLVMGFHAFPGRVPGGFVGVDVFFAISGFLISGLIIRDIREGTFSLRHFYARRIRRIFPALGVLLVVCLVVGGLVLTPTEYADLGLNAAAGAAFVSNLALWAQSGYFAAAAELKPLLHLWSLGVEEQFYFAWPLTLVFLFARTKRPWIAVAGIALLSFALNIYCVSPRPDAAFYSPLTRLWELLIGGLLAYRAERIRSGATPSQAPRGSLVPGASRNGASLLGLVLVAVAAMAFDGSQTFPGWRAAVPVVGTALCIAADGRESPLREAMGIKTIGWSYAQTGIVATVAHERPHEGVAQELFLASGPFAILPMTGNRSSIVWTERSEQAPAYVKLGDEAFLNEVAQRFGDQWGALKLEGPRWSYPLSMQLALSTIAPRFALAGDAGHSIHPIAGQGLNLGLRDAAALAETVIEAKRLGLDIGSESVLERYQSWRRFDNALFTASMDALNRLFSNSIAPIAMARRFGLDVVDSIPPLKRFFMRQAGGEGADLPRLMRGEVL